MSRSLLVRLSIIIFAIVSSGTLLWQEIYRYNHRTLQVVGIRDFDWKSLRAVIPNGETLGFITDKTNSEKVDESLYAANYTLAPLIVENTVNRRLLLGDFRNSSSIATALRRYGLRVAQDFGGGFLLLEHQ
jgi:hypothetical protein